MIRLLILILIVFATACTKAQESPTDCVTINVVSHHSLFKPVSFRASQSVAYTQKEGKGRMLNLYADDSTNLFKASMMCDSIQVGNYTGTVTYNNVSTPATFNIGFYNHNELSIAYEAGDVFGSVLSIPVKFY